MTKQQKGFGIIEIIFVVAVVALLGFVAWKAWAAIDNRQPAANGNETLQQAIDEPVPAVNNTADLDKVDKMLDDTNIEGDVQRQLDSETNF